MTPRKVDFPGTEDPRVVSYLDVLSGRVTCGPAVALVGAGGIGFDVAEYLVQAGDSSTLDTARWMTEWGVDPSFESRGGLAPARPEPPARQIWLLQRTAGKPGARLGKTTGWIHRASLKARGVRMLGGVEYLGVEAGGLRIAIDGIEQLLAVDHIVICAGQEPRRGLVAPLQAAGCRVHVIGGAEMAVELDAKRAIAQGSRLAAGL